MPRAAAPWVHRVSIRQYGPDDPFMRLFLFAVNSFSDENGFCHPGQAAIAEAACMGVSTVRRKSIEASQAGWLALHMRGSAGKAWKSYSYRLSVPDDVPIECIPKALAMTEKLEKQFGDIREHSTRGTLYPQKGSKRVPPAAGGRSEERPPADDTHYRPLNAVLPPADDVNDRPQRRGKFSVLSSQEVLSEGASGTALAKTREERNADIARIKAISKTPPRPSLHNAAWLRTNLSLGMDVERISKITAESPEEVRRAIANLDPHPEPQPRSTDPALQS